MTASRRLLYFPWWLVSSEACEWFPGSRATLDALRSAGFDVEVVQVPWQAGSDAAKPPATLEEFAEALAVLLKDGGHVVADVGSGMFVLIASAYREISLETLVLGPIPLPPATLRSLGLAALADSTTVAYRLERGTGALRQYLRLGMTAASEDQLESVAQQLEPSLNWDYVIQTPLLMADFNLLLKPPRISAPTLFMQTDLQFPGLLDPGIVQRFIPQAEIVNVPNFDLMNSDSGKRRADAAIQFINRQEGSEQWKRES